jgi:alpha-beta hydrolase superfamily lysophospholipase
MNTMMTCQGKLWALDGMDLYFRKDIPGNQKATFVFVHGLAEHCGRYEYVACKLNDFGYGVYRYDNRSHGQSGGVRGYVDDFQLFIDDADLLVEMARRENPGLPVFMLGHSMGGFIAAAYGSKYPGKLKGQVFTGAAVIHLPLFAELRAAGYEAVADQQLPNTLASEVCRDPQVVRAYEEDPLVLKAIYFKLLGETFIRGIDWLAENIANFDAPCLILHGGDDHLVPVASAEWLYANVSSQDKQIKIYPDLYHEILNEYEKDAVLEDIREWVEKHI